MRTKITFILLLLLLAVHKNVSSQHTYADWAKHIVALETTTFLNILTDGDAIIANGFWYLDAEFDGIELPYHVGSNALIAKMDIEGNVIWHSTMTGDGYDTFFDVALDGENNVIAVGWSSSNGYIEINGVTVYEPSMEWTSRGVVAKFSGEDGSLIWIKIINPSEEYRELTLTKVAVDTEDNIYISGYSNTSFEIDGVQFPYTQQGWGSLTYMAKLSSTGSVVWGSQFHFVDEGNAGWSMPRSIEVINNDILFAFQYSKPVKAGQDTLAYQGNGDFDWIGLVKLSKQDGNVLKTNAFGSSSEQNIASLTPDNNGNILVAGFFTSGSNFNIDGVIPMSYGLEDGYVAKLNNDFELVWLRSMGSEYSSRCFNISISPNDNRIFVGGGFDSYTPLYFEGHKLIDEESPTNSLAMFQVIMDDNGQLEKAFALHGEGIYSIVEYKDAVVLENDVVMAVGASVDHVSFVEGNQFFSDHWAGFLIKWDLSKEFYKIIFDIKDEVGNPLNNAVVTLEGVPNPYNVHSFYQIEQGVYGYSISLDGFESIQGFVEVVNQDVIVNLTMSLTSYDVVFEVIDEDGNPLDNAVISLGDTTNTANNYIFNQVVPGVYAYSVTLEGFITAEGEIEIINQDVVVNVTMSTARYNVFFEVVDEDGNPLENAIVTFDSTTNEPNNYAFYQIESGLYEYTVSLEGYVTYEGEIEIINQNVTVNVTMSTTRYDVFFEVVDEDGYPLENAIVTFDSITNEPNDYAFYQIENGLYEYTVSLDGYITYEGEIEVINQNTTVPVILISDNTSANSLFSTLVNIFPNPSSSHITIVADSIIEQIIISDAKGQLVRKQRVGANSTQVVIQGLPQGLYLLRITTKNGIATKRLQIIQ